MTVAKRFGDSPGPDIGTGYRTEDRARHLRRVSAEQKSGLNYLTLPGKSPRIGPRSQSGLLGARREREVLNQWVRVSVR